MDRYWDDLFSKEGALWQFEPADSARLAVQLFLSENKKTILIPGFGYGRNARYFLENGFQVTGIEISESAIRLARENGIRCPVLHGSVTSVFPMHQTFEGIYCYALLHLLNKSERKSFLQKCFETLVPGGLMIFVLASDQLPLFGTGRYLSKNRFEIHNGLKVFFYDDQAIQAEFKNYYPEKITNFAEPVKFMKDQPPLEMKLVVCRKK